MSMSIGGGSGHPCVGSILGSSKYPYWLQEASPTIPQNLSHYKDAVLENYNIPESFSVPNVLPDQDSKWPGTVQCVHSGGGQKVRRLSSLTRLRRTIIRIPNTRKGGGSNVRQVTMTLEQEYSQHESVLNCPMLLAVAVSCS